MPESGATYDPLPGDQIRSSDVALREALITSENPRWLSGLDFTNVGLAATFSSGYVWVAGSLSKFGSAVPKTLTASQTNYVYADGQGNIIINTTGVQPGGTVALYAILCGVSGPTTVTDLRDNTMSLTVPHSASQYTATASAPVNAGHLTRKDYVDAQVLAGATLKLVRIASTANLGLSGLAAIDGVTPSAGDRILAKDQTTGSQNGIYVAASGAWTRATDFSTGIVSGTKVAVSEGTANADTTWSLTTNGTIAIGTTALTFTLDSVTGQRGTSAGLATLTGGVHTTSERPAATTSVIGDVRLSVAPVSPSVPIAVGDNDSRMTDSRTPTGSAGGDLGSTYPNPTVLKLNGSSLPSNIGDGFLKRNAANGAWEEVAYGFASNTVMQGSSRLDQISAPTASVSMNSQRIVNLLDPSGAQDAATKAYVDATANGLDLKASVRVATTGSNITLSGGAPNTLDGVSLATNDRILVKDQTTGSQNGIYTVTTLGTGANGTWTRATDADTSAEVTAGMFAFVMEGTVNGDNGFVLVTNDPITLGTTALVFTQFSGAGQVIAGNGLTKTGNQLDFNPDNSTIEVASDQARLKDGGTTNAKLANMVQTTLKGRAAAGGTGAPQDLTAAQAIAILQTADGTGSGLDADLLDGLDSSATSSAAATIMSRDANGRSEVEDPSTVKQVANKRYVDALTVPTKTMQVSGAAPILPFTVNASADYDQAILTSDGKTVYLVYQESSAIVRFTKSTDGGKTWSSPVTVINDGTFTASYGPRIVIGDANNVYVFGAGQDTHDAVYMCRSTDGGATWSAKKTVADNGSVSGVVKMFSACWTATNTLYCIQSHSAVAPNVVIRKSTDNGDTWSTTLTPGTALLNSPVWIGGSGANVIAVYNSTANTYVSVFTSNSGTSWGSAVTITTTGPATASVVMEGSTSDGVNAYVAWNNASTPQIYKTTNSGTSWASVTLPATPTLLNSTANVSVHSQSAGAVLAFAFQVSSTTISWGYSTDGGTTWSVYETITVANETSVSKAHIQASSSGSSFYLAAQAGTTPSTVAMFRSLTLSVQVDT